MKYKLILLVLLFSCNQNKHSSKRDNISFDTSKFKIDSVGGFYIPNGTITYVGTVEPDTGRSEHLYFGDTTIVCKVGEGCITYVRVHDTVYIHDTIYSKAGTIIFDEDSIVIIKK